MQITVKLYAGLSEFLPKDAKQNSTNLDISDEETPLSVLERFNIPEELAHLVLLNGIYIKPEERSHSVLSEGDTLAVWPPVAGG